jgi:hypothetical protein
MSTDEDLVAWLQEATVDANEQAIHDRLLRFTRMAAPIVRRSRRRRLVIFVLVALFGTSASAAAITLGRVRIGGIELRFSPQPTSKDSSVSAPVPVTVPGSIDTWPGEPVTLEEAKRRFKHKVLLPKMLRAPVATYFLTPPESGQVTAIWAPSKMFPKTTDPKVGLIFTQFRGSSTGATIMKKQQVSSGMPTIETVRVHGSEGRFLSGPNHLVVIVDDSGTREENARLATNTLIWTEKEFTYRLEGNMKKSDALKIANSVR